jgi:hypothetical protein
MMGQRGDINIEAPLDFTQNDWEVRLLAFVDTTGQQRTPWFIDYFVFTRGLYSDLPALVIGRVGWDNSSVLSWLLPRPVILAIGSGCHRRRTPALMSVHVPFGMKWQILREVRGIDPRPIRHAIRPALMTIRLKFERHLPFIRAAG